MKNRKWIQIALGASLLIMTSALVAQAQNNRTFVSSTGTDAGSCTQASPCRTFNFAIGVTNNAVQVVALTSDGYAGISNINKAITIEASPGVNPSSLWWRVKQASP